MSSEPIIAITDISFQLLGDLLLSNLSSPKYNLTTEQQTIIQTFIQKSPTVVEKLSGDINAITSDGKLDLHDIPHIIQLLADTYQLYSESNPLLAGDNLIVFIQYTVNVIIDSKFVELPYFEKEIIEALVNTCIQLLRTNIIPKVKSWFPCYK
jgi:hypothetical protein